MDKGLSASSYQLLTMELRLALEKAATAGAGAGRGRPPFRAAGMAAWQKLQVCIVMMMHW